MDFIPASDSLSLPDRLRATVRDILQAGPQLDAVAVWKCQRRCYAWVALQRRCYATEGLQRCCYAGEGLQRRCYAGVGLQRRCYAREGLQRRCYAREGLQRRCYAGEGLQRCCYAREGSSAFFLLLSCFLEPISRVTLRCEDQALESTTRSDSALATVPSNSLGGTKLGVSSPFPDSPWSPPDSPVSSRCSFRIPGPAGAARTLPNLRSPVTLSSAPQPSAEPISLPLV
ncbi:uncharacterized protein LOC110367029 [Fundulus heteroclitus]|uniref:uncharacterized protein LOC110367029 n=1 Tax=Fundulus heteroclitus TaxID=8078 RepID=UPI00165ADA80|nr:uncharacterized protein LOC110367029 [Fundulus heteroclitus]